MNQATASEPNHHSRLTVDARIAGTVAGNRKSDRRNADSHKEGSLRVWMDRYVDGDQVAFAQLHRRLKPKVRARLRRMSRDEALVDDLVQQTFLRAHQARRRYSALDQATDRAVEGWFLAIARNVALDAMRAQYRRDRRHATLQSRGELEGMGVPTEVPEPESVQLEIEREAATAKRVHDAIEQLSASQREIVHMHKLAELPMADISKQLGVRPGALRVRAHRAYKALARVLTPQAVPAS